MAYSTWTDDTCRAWRGTSLLLIAAHGDCNGNGATETAAIDQLQWQWGKRTGATAIAVAMALLGHWGSSDSDCNGNGNGAHD
jgi:hypothetical protein